MTRLEVKNQLIYKDGVVISAYTSNEIAQANSWPDDPTVHMWCAENVTLMYDNQAIYVDENLKIVKSESLDENDNS